MERVQLSNLYEVLQIPTNEIAKFENIEKEINITYIKKLFHKNEDAFFEYLDENFKNKYLEVLYIYLNLTIDLFDMYIEQGIDINVYYDTIDDIRIWANNCVKEVGVYGLKEIYWINEHLRMRIFKLGRLQFQKREASEFMDLIKENNLSEYVKRDYFYFVHIPEGERLSHDLVVDSYNRACEFFNDYMIFAAESWILSDRMELLFDENANLMKFKNDFIVLSQRRDENHIKRYLKENSKLFKVVTELEEKGVMIGEGFGICLKYINR